jgi:predicted nucleotidyltransferase
MPVLNANQQVIVRDLSDALANVSGVQGVVLGGSYARGMARADSDIDLGIYYSEESPLSIGGIREIAAAVSDLPNPVVSELFEWGPWVNGGAWLTIQGQRVDFIYRSLEHLERVISDAQKGRYELHFGQQPPFGYFGPTYLGELAIARPLEDPFGRIAELQRRVTKYPEALRREIVQDFLWSADFSLHAFGQKFAARGEVYLTASTIARCIHALVLVLFALNRRYLVNDKTALQEISSFALCPKDFQPRVEALLGGVGDRPSVLADSVDVAVALYGETVELSGDLYSPKYDLAASTP